MADPLSAYLQMRPQEDKRSGLDIFYDSANSAQNLVQGRQGIAASQAQVDQGERALSLRERSQMRAEQEEDMMAPLKKLQLEANMLQTKYNIDNFGRNMELYKNTLEVQNLEAETKASLLKEQLSDKQKFLARVNEIKRSGGKIDLETLGNILSEAPSAANDDGVKRIVDIYTVKEKEQNEARKFQEQQRQKMAKDEQSILNKALENQQKSDYAAGELAAAQGQELSPEDQNKNTSFTTGWRKKKAEMLGDQEKAENNGNKLPPVSSRVAILFRHPDYGIAAQTIKDYSGSNKPEAIEKVRLAREKILNMMESLDITPEAYQNAKREIKESGGIDIPDVPVTDNKDGQVTTPKQATDYTTLY